MCYTHTLYKRREGGETHISEYGVTTTSGSMLQGCSFFFKVRLPPCILYVSLFDWAQAHFNISPSHDPFPPSRIFPPPTHTCNFRTFHAHSLSQFSLPPRKGRISQPAVLRGLTGKALKAPLLHTHDERAAASGTHTQHTTLTNKVSAFWLK